MTEQVDRELQVWMADWQAARPASPPAEQIREHARARSRQARLWVASEWIIALVAIAFLTHRAWTNPDPLERMAMSLLALVTAGALSFTWWNWRGALGAQAASTATFIAQSIERTRRFARGVRAAWVLLGLEVAIFAPWVAYRLYGVAPIASVERQLFAWGFLAAMTLFGALGLVALGRWTRREARMLDELRRDLVGEG